MAALVFLSCLRGRASGPITPQLMYPACVRPAERHTALRAGHPGDHVTHNDVSWDVPPLHAPRGAPNPRTRDRLAVTREVVFVPKVTRDAASISRNECRALCLTVPPQTWKHGHVWGIPPFTT